MALTHRTRLMMCKLAMLNTKLHNGFETDCPFPVERSECSCLQFQFFCFSFLLTGQNGCSAYMAGTSTFPPIYPPHLSLLWPPVLPFSNRQHGLSLCFPRHRYSRPPMAPSRMSESTAQWQHHKFWNCCSTSLRQVFAVMCLSLSSS